MSISFRITLLARITFHGCKIAILFCWYFSVWLLGLQPGPANNSHLRNISQLNSLHIPHVSWTASRRKHKRTRPRTRTLRHMAMKRLRRWVLPVASRHFQECFRQVLLLLLCPRRATQALTRHSLSSAERLAPEHASSELPAKPSRCAPCRVEFVGSNLAALSQADMTSRILSGLDAWCDGLVLPHLQVQQWTADLRLAKPACATRPHNAKVMGTILRVAACVGQLVEMRSVAWEHIQSLNVVLEALCFWIFSDFSAHQEVNFFVLRPFVPCLWKLEACPHNCLAGPRWLQETPPGGQKMLGSAARRVQCFSRKQELDCGVEDSVCPVC